jgi:LmbE family N-acetylglucosaminyl deacetylase
LDYIVEPLHPLQGSKHDMQHIAELYNERSYSNDSEPRPVAPTQEGEHWVPAASFALAAAFRSRHAPNVSMDAMVDLLAQLNAVRRSKTESRRGCRVALLGRVVEPCST